LQNELASIALARFVYENNNYLAKQEKKNTFKPDKQETFPRKANFKKKL